MLNFLNTLLVYCKKKRKILLILFLKYYFSNWEKTGEWELMGVDVLCFNINMNALNI